MEVRYFFDADTGRPHFELHGVLEAEVIQTITSPDELQGAREGAIAATKKLPGGKTIRVIFTEQRGSHRFVITAYALAGRQLDSFKRRRRKKP